MMICFIEVPWETNKELNRVVRQLELVILLMKWMDHRSVKEQLKVRVDNVN